MARPLRIRSIRGPMILFAVSLVLIVALAVLWNVTLAYDWARLKAAAQATGGFHATFIALGSVLFVLVIVLLSVLGAQLVSQVRFSQLLSASMATFTHELKSPLASIKMFAQTLLRPGMKEEERHQFLNLILVDVDRLTRQITNVLDAAQLDSLKGLRIEPESLDLQAFLEEYVQQKQPYLSRLAAGTRLELVPGPQVVVQVDPQAISSVLDNLVDNAVKYAREGSGVTIRLVVLATERPDRVAVEVQDDGSGVAAADLPRLFQRFSTIESAAESKRRRGTGLGLWIVDQIVAAHGGKTAARSAGQGQGTTIRLELPCWVEPEGGAAEGEALAAAAGARAAREGAGS